MKIKVDWLIIKSVFFSILVTILIYNYRALVYYLLRQDVESLKYGSIIRFFVYLFGTLILFKNKNVFKTIVIFFLPVFFIDSTTLIFGKELIPLRFPFATVYPLFGIYLGALINQKKYKTGLIFGTFCVIFFVISEIVIIPSLVWFIHQNRSLIIKDSTRKTFFDNHFLTTDSVLISLNDTCKQDIVLVELYFVGCKPCEEKKNVLKALSRKYNKNKLKIILICNSEINTFQTFRNSAKKEDNLNFTYLYDIKNEIKKLNISGYPTELLFGNKKLIKTDIGFGKSVENKWLQMETDFINMTIHEK